MKNFLLYVAIILLLVGCTDKPTLNMELTHAKISRGYINSSANNLGEVYLWDTEQDTLSRRLTIDLNERIDDNSRKTITGDVWSKRNATVDKNTKIELSASPTSGIPAETVANAKIEFANTTNVFIENYQKKALIDPLYVLNSKSLRLWRENLKKDGYVDNTRYKFILISAVIQGKKAVVSFNKDRSSELDVNTIKIGKYNFKAVYNNNQKEEIIAVDKAPLIINVSVLELKKDTIPKKYEGLRFSFSKDTEKIFDYQAM